MSEPLRVATVKPDATATFCQYLHYYMDRTGLSENKLAKLARINQSTLNKIKNGATKKTEIDKLINVCLVLGLDETEADDLLARRECALSPANATHRIYRELIRIYAAKGTDKTKFGEYEYTDFLAEADEYLESRNHTRLPEN